ncbi:hypothetical protein [Streptomyces sp. CC228A]|uniref:hypothetical protein n=1 Tax=Streptomyces sp. CC228A TaxID=2898186 RepID=UPI001F3F2EEC|nr:hypothetical protein [Streptomyces sp. CC228A]
MLIVEVGMVAVLGSLASIFVAQGDNLMALVFGAGALTFLADAVKRVYNRRNSAGSKQ